MQEDYYSSLAQHQASMYDTSNRPVMDENQTDDRVTPSKRLSNVINRQPSLGGGQCPFSVQRNGTEN